MLPWLVLVLPAALPKDHGDRSLIFIKVRSRRLQSQALLIISHITTITKCLASEYGARHFFLQNTCKFQIIIVSLQRQIAIAHRGTGVM